MLFGRPRRYKDASIEATLAHGFARGGASVPGYPNTHFLTRYVCFHHRAKPSDLRRDDM